MPGPGDNREALLWVSHCEVGTRCFIDDRLSASPQISKVGTWIFGRRSRASTCAEAMAISRKPTGRKSDMMLANSSRTSFVADSLNIPWSTSAQTRWAVARRLAGRPPSVVQRLCSGSEPFQLAYVSAKTSDSRGRGMAPIELLASMA